MPRRRLAADRGAGPTRPLAIVATCGLLARELRQEDRGQYGIQAAAFSQLGPAVARSGVAQRRGAPAGILGPLQHAVPGFASRQRPREHAAVWRTRVMSSATSRFAFLALLTPDSALFRQTIESASAGAIGAVIAALLAAFTEPVLNRVVGRKLGIRQALREVRPLFVLRYFRTALATNLLKFPFFEAVNTITMSWLWAPTSLQGFLAAAIYTTAMLPVANYRYAMSLQMRVSLGMLYKAFWPTLLRDVIYGITRRKVATLICLGHPSLAATAMGRSATTFLAVGCACILSAPGNELRAFILQPRDQQRMAVKEFFQLGRFVRSTIFAAMIVSLSIAVGQLLIEQAQATSRVALQMHPSLQILVMLWCAQEFRILSLVAAIFAILRLEKARQVYDNTGMPRALQALKRYKDSGLGAGPAVATEPSSIEDVKTAQRALLEQERAVLTPATVPTTAALAKFVAPAFCNVVANSSMSAVDKLYIGYHSSLQLAALGPAATAFDGGSYLLTFLNTATMSLLGQAVGSKRRLNRVRSHALILATGSAVVLGGFLAAFAAPLCSLLGATSKMLPYSVTYLQLRALGAPIERGTSVSTSFCLAAKDGATPLAITLIGLCINVTLDALLCPKFGSAGVAVASVMASTVGYAYLIYSLWKNGMWPKPLDWPKRRGDITPFLGFAGPVLLAVFLKILTFGQMTRAACLIGTRSAAAHQMFVSLFYLTAVALGNPFSWAAQAFLPPLLVHEASSAGFGAAQPAVAGRRRRMLSVVALRKMVLSALICAFAFSMLVVGICRSVLGTTVRDAVVRAHLSGSCIALVPFLTLYPVLLTYEGALYSLQRQGQVLVLSLAFWLLTCVVLSGLRVRGSMTLSTLWLAAGATCALSVLIAWGTTSRVMKAHVARCEQPIAPEPV